MNIHMHTHTHMLLHDSPLANKQASKQQQALLLSVLTIAPFQRFGLYSTLAILEPRWWPCQIQVFSQKLTGGAPGRGRQVGRCCPKTAHFVPENSLFWPKTVPKPSQNGQTKANSSYTSRAPRLPRDQEPFLALFPPISPHFSSFPIFPTADCGTSPGRPSQIWLGTSLP